MGLFDKIKNILFEDEDEVGSIPVYSKDDLKGNEPKVVSKEKVVEPVKRSNMYDDEKIDMGTSNHFRNVKRDIDFSFDEEDDLSGILNKERKNENKVVPSVEKVEEKPVQKSVFQSFDEEEFERLNARVNQNEKKVKRDVPKTSAPEIARKANNNFSPTGVKSDDKRRSVDRYKVDLYPHKGKKPFTPSPVISPVYGILDKNYTVDEIVDKKDGLKREKSNPIVYTPEIEVRVSEPEVKHEVFVDVDSVRKKAFGELEDYENQALLEAQKRREERVLIEEELPLLDKGVSPVVDEVEDEVVDIVEEESSLREVSVDDDYVEDVQDDDNDDFVVKKPRELDDIEKTSTLQILDDIERELNSIKPIHDEYKMTELSSDDEESVDSDDSLEDDLFHLIDSMYEQGEEDEEDD